jgi:ParB family transcriptional regulator, chromosome partitioning protein
MKTPDIGKALDIPPRLTTRTRTWTGDNEWFTPPDIIKAACAVIGERYTDPASSDAAQSFSPIKATTYYTIVNHGLDKEWNGAVWLNPPYSRGWIDVFVNKFVEEYQTGRMTAGILLTNSSTETKWWHKAADISAAICFPKSRIRFLKVVDGKLVRGGSPSHPHCFFYVGTERERFAQVFSKIGLVR